jgi:hypothetical protein
VIKELPSKSRNEPIENMQNKSQIKLQAKNRNFEFLFRLKLKISVPIKEMIRAKISNNPNHGRPGISL